MLQFAGSCRVASFFRLMTIACVLSGASNAHAQSKPIKALFLGDNGHHKPRERAEQLMPVLAKVGIDVTYTEKLDDLNEQNLAKYDCLIIYANQTRISPEQEAALLSYVENGKGLVPLHCASYCFLNSPKYIALVGAQFRRHGTGVFRTTSAGADHPLMKGYSEFESWDETYVHHLHNEKDRIVLSYRTEGDNKEPWTWVRTQGKGRVFYTAWGHDERTWGHAGFQNLVERGIRWSVGADLSVVAAFNGDGSSDNSVTAAAVTAPKMTEPRKDVKPFEYVEAKVAFYPPNSRGSNGGGSWNKMQLPVDPAESQKHYVTPVDFKLELFVAEPNIGKPITMNWDERGRLWIAETVDYPNELQPEGSGRDRIRICEDTDGDGKADRFTVFAEKLSIPTSMTFANGGVIVHQAPHTLFLKDTNGDDKADVRQELFTGWGTRDTHAGPNNLQYGLDNWIWGMVGYSGFRGSVGGEQLTFSQGFYRFKPDGSKLEFLRSTNNNTWGIGFSEEGLVFGSTANRNPSVYLPIPNRYYERVRGWSASQLGTIADTHLFHAYGDKVRQVDHHGGYTAAAGHALYTARAYPKMYWNRLAFVTEPTGHLVGTFVLNRDGTDFKSTNPFNLVASDDEWAAPIMAEVGPDGHVWIIDWYNYIVQHNPTPVGFQTGRGAAYETDLRDKKHGRIYRIVYTKAAAAKTPDLKNATPQELVATLAHDNLFWRKHAQRLLVERKQGDTVPALIDLVNDPRVDEIGLNAGAIHALWTLHGLGVLAGNDAKPQTMAAVVKALAHKSAGVRRNAVAVLPRTKESTDAILAAKLLDDGDPQVRLATLLALSEMPANIGAAAAIAACVNKAENATDRWLPDAAISAAAAHDVHFLTALAASKTPVSTRAPGIAAIVAEHYSRGNPQDTVGPLLVALAGADRAIADVIVAGLTKGWPKNQPAKLDAGVEQAVVGLLKTLSPGAQGQLINLAASWGSKAFEKNSAEIAASLLAAASDEKQGDAARVASARQLVEFRADDAATAGQLLDLVSPRTPPTVAAGLIDALGSSRASGVGPALIDRLGSLTPAARGQALTVLLGRPEWTRALLTKIEEGQAQLADLSLEQKQSLAAHPDRRLAGRARQLMERGGALPSADRQKVLDELMPLVSRAGNVEQGKAVFKTQCAKCHTHSGEGSKIGPDLTGMAVHPKAELLTQIIDPSRSVEGNYRVYAVATKDGRVLNGLLASETKTSVELFDVEGKQHAVQREDIEELVASTKSLMPEGFEKQLKPDDVVNLLEFLAARGKYLPLPLNKVATVVTTKGMFHEGDNGPDRLVFSDWGPKTSNGIPFQLIDPRGKSVPNGILLNGPQGTLPPKMPRSVKVPCNSSAKAIHLLSGISGWGYPASGRGSVSMIVRLHYKDGKTEDHPLKNGEHFADYIRHIDVPNSQFAFLLNGQQLRYLAVEPLRDEIITEVEFVKGDDRTAPIVMAATVEGR